MIQLTYRGSQIPTRISQIGLPFPAETVTVYNNTPAQWYVSTQYLASTDASGSSLATVPAYYAQTIALAADRNVYLLSDGTPIPSGATLNIAFSEQVQLPFFAPYGPSAWGGGSNPSPTTITSIAAGDPFLWWQIQQLVGWLTGDGTGSATPLQLSSNSRDSSGAVLNLYRPNIDPTRYRFFRTGTGAKTGHSINWPSGVPTSAAAIALSIESLKFSVASGATGPYLNVYSYLDAGNPYARYWSSAAAIAQSHSLILPTAAGLGPGMLLYDIVDPSGTTTWEMIFFVTGWWSPS